MNPLKYFLLYPNAPTIEIHKDGGTAYTFPSFGEYLKMEGAVYPMQITKRKLLLKPLSLIAEEDRRELAAILIDFDVMGKKVWAEKVEYEDGWFEFTLNKGSLSAGVNKLPYKAADFLREKGYCLDREAVEAGIVKTEDHAPKV